MNSRLSSFLSILTALLTPIFLIGLALRLLLTPVFPQIEYRMPGFPPDEYSFTLQDRLHWSKFAVEYLVNDADISYLGDLQFEDGSPLFNERELSHMDDVKAVTRGALAAFYAVVLVLAALGLWAWRGDWLPAFRQGLRRGGWLMVALAALIGVIVAAGMFLSADLFWAFFSGFHTLFFEGDSWLFLYSDTLIRLFPLRFWQDAFLWAAVIALGGGLALGLGLKTKGKFSA
ncbi:MAG: TIGR01906 family membrane protein [Chloroflexota bacterium]